MEQPFYFGQEVVYNCQPSHSSIFVPKLIDGNVYIVDGYSSFHPNGIYIRGHRTDLLGAICSYHIIHFAPVERTRTKYVVKEVEVAPAIRELEVCKS